MRLGLGLGLGLGLLTLTLPLPLTLTVPHARLPHRARPSEPGHVRTARALAAVAARAALALAAPPPLERRRATRRVRGGGRRGGATACRTAATRAAFRGGGCGCGGGGGSCGGGAGGGGGTARLGLLTHPRAALVVQSRLQSGPFRLVGTCAREGGGRSRAEGRGAKGKGAYVAWHAPAVSLAAVDAASSTARCECSTGRSSPGTGDRRPPKARRAL